MKRVRRWSLCVEPAKKPATVRYHFHFANAAERAYKTVVGGLTAASTVLFEGRVQPRHRTGPSHAGCVLKSKIGGCHEGEAARGTREARNPGSFTCLLLPAVVARTGVAWRLRGLWAYCCRPCSSAGLLRQWGPLHCLRRTGRRCS